MVIVYVVTEYLENVNAWIQPSFTVSKKKEFYTFSEACTYVINQNYTLEESSDTNNSSESKKWIYECNDPRYLDYCVIKQKEKPEPKGIFVELAEYDKLDQLLTKRS